jgi:hypothetical protein
MLTGIRTTSHDRPTRRRGRLTAAVAGATLALGVAAPVPTATAAAPGAIAGTVTDGAVPLAGIEVTILDSTPYGLVPVGQDVTDAAGGYQVDGIEADPFYAVRFSDPAGEYATEMWDDAIVAPPYGKWVAVTGATTTPDIDAALEAGSTLSGRLTRAGGAPVSGGTIALWWKVSGQSFARVSDHVADADGRWSIPGVRGATTYALEFSDPVTGVIEAWDDRPAVIGSTPLEVASGVDRSGLDAQLGGVVTNVSAPAISGTPQVGQTLTAAPGTWQPADSAVSYRWIVGDDVSPGDDPTGSTYAPTAQDVGKTIRVEVTGTRGAGWTPATALSAPTAPVAAAPVVVLQVVNDREPRIKGTLRVGRTVRVTTGTWTPYPQKLRFRWYAGKRAIAGATHQRLRLTKKLAGKRLRVVVKASAPGHASLTVTTQRSGKVRR